MFPHDTVALYGPAGSSKHALGGGGGCLGEMLLYFSHGGEALLIKFLLSAYTWVIEKSKPSPPEPQYRSPNTTCSGRLMNLSFFETLI